MAGAGLESLEAQACQQYVPGRCRNMHVALRITNLASRPMLVPVWIMAYRYRDKMFRFLANGQTGKCSGQAPLSYRKIVGAIIIAILVMIFLLFLFSQMARGGIVAAGENNSAEPGYARPTPLVHIQSEDAILPGHGLRTDFMDLFHRVSSLDAVAGAVRIREVSETAPRWLK
jgi:hypothetical protein